MHHHALHHVGLDVTGHRHCRKRSLAAMRRCSQQVALMPRVTWVVACAPPREVWRNGLHRRRWQAVADGVRIDRRCFLATLPRPALVPPFLPVLGW